MTFSTRWRCSFARAALVLCSEALSDTVETIRGDGSMVDRLELWLTGKHGLLVKDSLLARSLVLRHST